MSDNDPSILEKAGMKVGDLIGRYLPEPDPDKGGHALNIAIVGVLALTFISLVASGLFAAVIEFIVLTGAVILGMYAGGPVFLRLQAKRGTPPTPPGTPDPKQTRHRRSGGNPFSP